MKYGILFEMERGEVRDVLSGTIETEIFYSSRIVKVSQEMLKNTRPIRINDKIARTIAEIVYHGFSYTDCDVNLIRRLFRNYDVYIRENDHDCIAILVIVGSKHVAKRILRKLEQFEEMNTIPSDYED